MQVSGRVHIAKLTRTKQVAESAQFEFSVGLLKGHDSCVSECLVVILTTGDGP